MDDTSIAGLQLVVSLEFHLVFAGNRLAMQKTRINIEKKIHLSCKKGV